MSPWECADPTIQPFAIPNCWFQEIIDAIEATGFGIGRSRLHHEIRPNELSNDYFGLGMYNLSVFATIVCLPVQSISTFR
jgi:hypothetical protein